MAHAVLQVATQYIDSVRVTPHNAEQCDCSAQGAVGSAADVYPGHARAAAISQCEDVLLPIFTPSLNLMSHPMLSSMDAPAAFGGARPPAGRLWGRQDSYKRDPSTLSSCASALVVHVFFPHLHCLLISPNLWHIHLGLTGPLSFRL